MKMGKNVAVICMNTMFMKNEMILNVLVMTMSITITMMKNAVMTMNTIITMMKNAVMTTNIIITIMNAMILTALATTMNIIITTMITNVQILIAPAMIIITIMQTMYLYLGARKQPKNILKNNLNIFWQSFSTLTNTAWYSVQKVLLKDKLGNGSTLTTYLVKAA